MVFVGLAILCLLLFIPGYLAMTWAGVPRLLSLAVSPAWVGLAAGGLGLIYDLVGLWWNLWSFLGGIAVLLVAWMVVVSLVRGASGGVAGSTAGSMARSRQRGSFANFRQRCLRRPPQFGGTREPLSKGVVIGSWVIFLVALVLPIGVLAATGLLNYAAQGHDAVFHLNGAWYVRESGNANIFSSMSCLYGIAYDQDSYYPAVWHALVALVPSSVTIVQSTNALMIATYWIWTVALAALARYTLHRVQCSLPLMLGFSLLFTVFPAYLLNRRLWPNALELAMLPAIIALSYWAWTSFRREKRRGKLLLMLLVLVPLFGATVVYPASLVALLFVLIPAYVYLLVRVVKWMHRRFSRKAFVISLVGAMVVVAAGLAVALVSPQIAGRLSATITRAGTAYLNKVASLFIYWPRDGVTWAEMLGLGAVAVLTVGGILLTWRSKRFWWIPAFWAMSALLLVGTLFYVPGLSHLTLLFYSATWRLVPLELIFALQLTVICASWVIVRLQRLVQGMAQRLAQSRAGKQAAGSAVQNLGQEDVVTSLSISSLTPKAVSRSQKPAAWWLPGVLIAFTAAYCTLAPLPSRLQAEQNSRMPDASADTYMYDQAELDMIESLSDLIDDGKLLIGDQLSGAAMVQAVSDIPVLVAHGTIDSSDWVGKYLAQNFDQIGADPLVCELIDEYNIGYFYQDETAIGNGSWRDQETPAYYQVDPEAAGFELVAAGGSAKVWRITGCG